MHRDPPFRVLPVLVQGALHRGRRLLAAALAADAAAVAPAGAQNLVRNGDFGA